MSTYNAIFAIGKFVVDVIHYACAVNNYLYKKRNNHVNNVDWIQNVSISSCLDFCIILGFHARQNKIIVMTRDIMQMIYKLNVSMKLNINHHDTVALGY